MKSYFYFIITLFACSIFVSSCGSDEGSEPSPETGCETRKSQLTSGSSATWKISKLELDIPSLGVVDVFSSNVLTLIGSPEIITCLQDNTVTFNADGNFTATEGNIVCEGFPANGTGKWSFSDNCDTLKLDAIDSLILLQTPALPISSFTEKEMVSQVKIDIDTVISINLAVTTVSIGPILDAKVTFGKQ